MIKSQPLKWHGGKTYQAPWIIGLMPPRVKNPNAPAADDPGWLHYVEPYFGGGAVLLAQDPEGISEVVNDKNKELANFWSVLASSERFALLQRRLVGGTPFSAEHYERSSGIACAKGVEQIFADVERATHFFVFCRQSMSGRMKGFAPLTRNRTRSGMNEQVSAWFGAIEGLPEVHERMRRVVILNNDALKVIKQQDGPRTLFYLDPPYLHETRETKTEYGNHEMTADDHASLLDVLCGIKGRFLLSGYPSVMYDDVAAAQGWQRYEMKIDNKASSKRKKDQETECVWTNY